MTHSLSCSTRKAKVHLPTFSGLPESLSGDEGISSVGMPTYETSPRMSYMGQSSVWQWSTFFVMDKGITILKVEFDGEDGLIVAFSDGTTARFVVEELLLLKPIREVVKELVYSK